MPTRRQLIATAAAGLAVSLAPLPGALRADQAPADQATVVKRGSFVGASGHATSGSGAILASGSRHFVSLGSDFSLDGAPDPKVALGRDGYDADTLLGPLEALAGAQTYPIPERLDPAAYDEIWIWCERFDVPLGVASLA
jgi:hypothetical protein